MKKVKELSVKEQQEIELDILKYLDKVLTDNQIRYFAAYGTLLGAVREKGFIPWDDDVDLWVFRKDIPKIIQVIKNSPHEGFFLQTFQSDPETIVPEMIRICVDNTYKWPEKCENEKFHTGIFLDIFPLIEEEYIL